MDLSTIFNSVATQLTAQQTELNQADSHNHDHGDHMVQIFNLIQSAVSSKSDQPIAEQLEYASEVVEKEANNGSGKLYSQGLAKAAQTFSGSELKPDNLTLLVKSLLNVEETPKEQGKPNLLGSVISGLKNKNKTAENNQTIGIDELLQAGMSFVQTKQQGGSVMDALMGALTASSPLGQSEHRTMSGAAVASTIMGFAQTGNN